MPARGPAPEWVALLNTSLIVISGFFLLLGYYFIRQRQIELHKRSMLTATVFAALFLVVYVSRALLFETKVFAGEGLVRVLYLAILISHTILALLVGPLALVTLRRALRGEFSKHRQIARVTFPMWLYVVATGWLIYWMLHSLSVEAY
jgi:putative membrane protein